MNTVNLFAAIYHNDIDNVRKILSELPSLVNEKFKDERDHSLSKQLYSKCNNDDILGNIGYKSENALLFSSRLCRSDIVDILINEFNADINSVNIYGSDLLMNSINENTDVNINMALHILKKHSVNLDHLNYSKYNILGEFLRKLQHFYGESTETLSLIKVQELIDTLLTKGLDINNKQGSAGETAFLLACSAHNWAIAIYLISKGADYSVNNTYFNYDQNMYSILCYNQYLDPKSKERIFNVIEQEIIDSGAKYGKYKKPVNLYVCPISGKILTYNEITLFNANNVED